MAAGLHGVLTRISVLSKHFAMCIYMPRLYLYICVHNYVCVCVLVFVCVFILVYCEVFM